MRALKIFIIIIIIFFKTLALNERGYAQIIEKGNAQKGKQ